MAETVSVQQPPTEVREQAKAAPVTRGCEQYRDIVNQYDWDVNVMLAVMKAENRGCDPLLDNYSAGETHVNAAGQVVCVGSYGLLQVGCLHFSAGQDHTTPSANVAVAYQVWKKQGYTAWTMYRNEEYLNFL